MLADGSLVGRIDGFFLRFAGVMGSLALRSACAHPPVMLSCPPPHPPTRYTEGKTFLLGSF